MLCMANFFSEKNTCMTAFKPNSELGGIQHDQNPYPIHNPFPKNHQWPCGLTSQPNLHTAEQHKIKWLFQYQSLMVDGNPRAT